MFYGQFILGKKGPLSKIWFAAHLEKKLSRNEILSTDVSSAVEEVIRPKVKLSLRLNGNLLLGIVRIYAKKASYILHDLERARKIFLHYASEKERQRQVRRARRIAAGGPEESTIVEEDELLGEMEITLPQMEEFANAPGPRFNGRANNSDITLREYNPLFGPVDLTYEDQIFEPEEENWEQMLDEHMDELSRPNSAVPDPNNQQRMMQDLEEMQLEESMEEARRVSNAAAESRLQEMPRNELKEATIGAEGISRLRGSTHEFEPLTNVSIPGEPMEFESFAVPEEIVGGPVRDESIFESNISLVPLSTSQIRQAVAETKEEQRRRAPRRRRAQHTVADQNTSLDDEEMRAHMSNIKDIVLDKIDFAPPTKRVMLAKQMGSIAHIFSNPATNIAINPAFMKLYNEHCILKARPLSDVPTAEQIREDMAFTAEPQLDPDEMGSRRSHTSSRAPSALPFVDQMLPDNGFLNDSMFQNNDLFNQPDTTFNNAAINNSLLDMTTHEPNMPFNESILPGTPLKEDEFEEDRENINPFARPATKRSRSDKELQAEEKRAKESARLLLRQIKSESARIGKQTLNFNELVLPNATTAEQIQQFSEEERRNMAKKASHQFYALLELRKSREVQVEQSAAFEPIFVTLI